MRLTYLHTLQTTDGSGGSLLALSGSVFRYYCAVIYVNSVTYVVIGAHPARAAALWTPLTRGTGHADEPRSKRKRKNERTEDFPVSSFQQTSGKVEAVFLENEEGRVQFLEWVNERSFSRILLIY